ncbi:MAG: GldG family protein, partial [Planctomycetota bacterium]
MNRTIRAIIGVVLVFVITFCAISISQNVGKSLKVDITDQKLYTLSDGTRAILAKLNQPVKVKLYYARTAALKGPDQIKYFNNYYEFVKALLEEYSAAAKGMIDLQIIDPRPFSEDEAQALRYGINRFPITEEESFFFGLAVQTPFGVEKAIPFFSPDRQNFVEYDISYLIDTAIVRQKKKIGILSSLPVMGEDVSGYMAQMRQMQGQRSEPPWGFVEQLKQQYEVISVPTDVNEIKDIDILVVIHPKDLGEQTLFAIDQFVL